MRIEIIYIHIQIVWGLWRKEVGVWKADPIKCIVLLVG